MQIHMYHQPIFFIARALISPLINRIGISTVAMGTYSVLWGLATNSARTVGLPGAFYIFWQLRRLLLRRVTARTVVNMLTNYVPLLVNSSLIRNIYRLNRINNNLPFVRVINWIMLSILGNMFNFIFKRFILYTGLVLFILFVLFFQQP